MGSEITGRKSEVRGDHEYEQEREWIGAAIGNQHLALTTPLFVRSRPGDEAELVVLLQMRMSRKDANAESVRAGFACGNGAAIEIAAVAILTGLIQRRYRRVFDAAVFGFAMISFNLHMLRIDCAEMNPGAYF